MTRSKVWLGVGAFALAVMSSVDVDPTDRDLALRDISLGGTAALAQQKAPAPAPAPGAKKDDDDGPDDDGPDDGKDDDGPDDDGPDDDDKAAPPAKK